MKIAIDGPAGAGKSTVARRLARELGILYVDTGAMYRALTWKGLKQGVNFSDSGELQRLAASAAIGLEPGPEGLRVICDGTDVTREIRCPEVSRAVSVLAADEGVRAIMVGRQQEIARCSDVVMDGRDITHCVLPDADFKFFLTASLEERAKRRGGEMEQQGYSVDMAALCREMAERDRKDMERTVGPLKITPEATVIDTSCLSLREVLDKVLAIIREG